MDALEAYKKFFLSSTSLSSIFIEKWVAFASNGMSTISLITILDLKADFANSKDHIVFYLIFNFLSI
jgi:hypothetical protein